MEVDSWLDNIEKIAFSSELQKLADSPIYPEEQNVDEEIDFPEDEDDGYIYHSDDGIMMRNNQDAKQKIDAIKKKAKGKI